MYQRVFSIYADSWFEIKKFIDSMIKLLNNDKKFESVKYSEFQKNIKNYVYAFFFTINDKRYNLIFKCYGKYKNNLKIKDIEKMLKNGGKPDLIFIENNQIILGIEDTDTSQVGNSSLQRMERVDFFIENNIDFLYLTYSESFDRSQKNKQERKPSASQLLFFETNNLDILYKTNQDNYDYNDDLLISKYFLNKIIKIKIDILYQKQIKDKIREEKTYKEIKKFIEENNDNWEWKPTFLNDSPILKKLHDEDKIFTFSSKKTQKVGFTKGLFLKDVLKQFGIDSKNIVKDDIYLINPVMFIQKSGNKIVKVDPATGEFVFYSKLFPNFKNITIIYSPQATSEFIKNTKSKLSHHIKDKSCSIILSNKDFNIKINKNDMLDYSNSILKNRIDEDDLDFIFYNYMKEKGYDDIYISAPCASWSRILYKGQKILDISKNDGRPDYIFINETKKIIIIGESKEKYIDLIKYREKHKNNFLRFSKKIIQTKLFCNYKIIEINISFMENNLHNQDFNYIGVIVKNDFSIEIKEFVFEDF